MKIAFCYNVKHHHGHGLSTQLDFDSPQTIDRITQVFTKLGHHVTRIEADDQAFFQLSKLKNRLDLVFNIAEGLSGDARESQIPLFCEMLGLPYTHSSPTVHALSLNKHLAKLAAKGLGVRVPPSILIPEGHSEIPRLTFSYPAIIKPNREGSSIGVFNDNVVKDRSALIDRIQELRRQGLTGELLVEKYLPGREFTVAVLDHPPQVLPIIEQKFDFLPSGLHPIAGFELKWQYEDSLKDPAQAYDCPAHLDTFIHQQLHQSSLLVFQGLGIHDCVRLDFRLGQHHRPYLLEFNTLPGINPDESVISYLPIAARTADLTFPQLLDRIINSALSRYHS